MYGTGKSAVGGGMRISPAANAAPAGGFGGVIVTFARIVDVLAVSGGTSWRVKVLSSS